MRRKTAQSKLFTTALSSLAEDNSEILPEQRESQVILDLAAIVCSVVKIPNTLRDLALQLLFLSSTIPSIHIACDKYKSFSFKSDKRSLEVSDKFVICGGEVGIPSDLKKRLSDRDK